MRFCPRCGTRFETEAFCPHDGIPTQELPEAGGEHDHLPGQVVDGRYRIDKQIGEGGMGIVYKATHTALNKTLALKILRGEMAKDQAVVQRFIQEAQAATSIGHENIIDISDFGKLPDGAVYFVMEFLDGQPLTEVVSRGGPAPVASAVRILRQIASALGAAHERGIVHRDLKPDNIFLIPRGDRDDFVKVLDFGIAKVGGASNKLTQTGMVFGTPHYMSPEQAAGQGVDHRTDIYALGVIMYELFTGHVPFDADTFMGVLTKHMFEEPPPMMRTGDERLLGALELVTFKALAKKPENRYQSMEELTEDLDRVMGGSAPRASVPGRSKQLADELEPRSISEMRLEQQLSGGDPARKSARRAMMWGGLGGLAIVGAAIAFVLSLDAPDEKSASDERDATEPEEMTAAAASDEPSPSSDETQATDASDAARDRLQAPAPPPKPDVELVVVEIVSEPSGASVVVDGAIIGATPAKFPRPREGVARKVELQLEGYRTHTLRLTPESPTQILVPLARAAVRRAPAPRRKPEPAPAPAPTRRRRTEVLDPWGDAP